MANYIGNDIKREDLLRRIGHMSQLASIEHYEMLDGKSNGCKVFDVTNGGGLVFRVLESKCLDISNLSFKGINLNFVSKPGLVSPEFFNPHGQEFPRHFHGGLLYTCGMLNVGPPCNDNGTELSQHGRVGQTPSENASIQSHWEGDDYIMKLSGEIREGKVFLENMVLKREISTKFGSKSIKIHDVVENQGFEEQPLMMLYHINLGYPLLDGGSRFVFPSASVVPRDEVSQNGMDDFRNFSTPIDQYEEQVFYHTVASDKDGNTMAGLVNEKLGLGIAIKYNSLNLPKLLEWKSMMSGDYTLGIEPANCVVDNRINERERGTLRTIKPFEKVCFDLEITVLEGQSEITAFENQVKAFK